MLHCARETKSHSSCALSNVANSRYLIVHADDLGLAHGVNQAIFAGIEKGIVSSTSVMVPCPWLEEAASYLRAHPAVDVGIHLTLTSEWNGYKWRPVAPRESVRSLVGPDGYFWPDEGYVVRNADLTELRHELEAQIDRAVRMGIKPTHVDTHMLALWQTPSVFKVFVEVARNHSLPFLASKKLCEIEGFSESVTADDFVLEGVTSIRPSVPVTEWENWYTRAIQKIPLGVTQLVVHLGADDAEMRAIVQGRTEWGPEWRERDFNAVTSSWIRTLVHHESITIIDWKKQLARH